MDCNSLADSFGSDEYSDEVRHDIYEARQLEIQSVPYFVFDRRYGVSGAQSSETFLEMLEKALAGWRQKNPEIQLRSSVGNSCFVDGECL
jgi:predicted DsbA family dithiol-disulfide isomerase